MSYITNYNKNSLISGSAYADTIKNYAGGVTIQGKGSNDSIFNSTDSSYTINGGYGYVTIDGGDGNDTIYSFDPRVSINGGAGADRISLGSWQGITVKGGAGNDTVNTATSRTSGIVYQFNYGDGNDSITNWISNDTLRVCW